MMKLFFFLIAFCLLSLRVYFSWFGKEKANRGESTSNTVIKSDNFIEEMKYSGRFELSDDETRFTSISPGGYMKYRKNDTSVSAESNLQGLIEYRIHEGSEKIPLDERGRVRIAEAIREMINWGFDAGPRMERIYRKGGITALSHEVDSMKTDPVKILYLNRLFANDSLSVEDRVLLINKTGSLSSDGDKFIFLDKISSKQFQNPQIAGAWFTVVENMGSDMDRMRCLHYALDLDPVTDSNAYKILTLTSKLGSDMDKADLYRKMIRKGLDSGARFPMQLECIAQMGSDMDKKNFYQELINQKNISDDQWIMVINKAAMLGSDMDKANLLIEIAQKMPKTEMIQSSYRKAAKSIGNDSDYGRTIRALD
jgi:hypothetical protein